MSLRVSTAKGLVIRRRTETPAKREPVRRLRSVRVRVKREPERIPVDTPMQEDRYAQAEGLYDFWGQRFQKAYGVEYVPRSKPADLGHLDEILDDIKEVSKIRLMMTLLLTHADLAWVGQKNLAWLAKARNRTFIAPLLVRRSRTAEYSGSRTLTTKITFRGS